MGTFIFIEYLFLKLYVNIFVHWFFAMRSRKRIVKIRSRMIAMFLHILVLQYVSRWCENSGNFPLIFPKNAI